MIQSQSKSQPKKDGLTTKKRNAYLQAFRLQIPAKYPNLKPDEVDLITNYKVTFIDSAMKARQTRVVSHMVVQQAENKALFLLFYQINGANVADACKRVGVDRKTFYNWRDTDPQFRIEAEYSEDVCTDNVESALYKNALGDNFPAQKFYLENKRPEKWRTVEERKVESEVTLPGLLEALEKFGEKVLQNESTLKAGYYNSLKDGEHDMLDQVNGSAHRDVVSINNR